jgi:two-component system, NarL family, nitrate/nitrite response regulator NarL
MRARLSERTHEQQSAFCDASTRSPQVGSPHIFILSDVRLYREGVAMNLARNPTVEVVGMGPASGALASMVDLHPDVVLLDSSLVDSSALPRRMREALPQLKIVAFAVSDADHEVIACAEAGISAFVAREGSAEDLVAAVHQAMRGELVCSPRVTALLLNRLASLSAERATSIPIDTLTQREKEIIPLVERGLSNKEIARQLRVGAATVKNHIHNILEKLQVRRRGEVAARLRADSAFALRSSGGASSAPVSYETSSPHLA